MVYIYNPLDSEMKKRKWRRDRGKKNLSSDAVFIDKYWYLVPDKGFNL